MNGKLLQRAEIVGQREEIEALIEQSKRTNAFEIENVARQSCLDNEINSISDKIDIADREYTLLLARKDELHEEIAVAEESVFNQKLLRDSLVKEIEEGEALMEQEFLEIQRTLSENSEYNSCVQEFEPILKELLRTHADAMSRKIREKQFSLILIEESKLKEDYECEVKRLTSQIEAAQTPTPMKQESQIETLPNNLLQLTKELEALQPNFRLRSATIAQWKQLYEKETSDQNISESDSDSIHSKFEALLKEKKFDENEQDFIRSYFGSYIGVIEKHEPHGNESSFFYN